MALKRFRVLHGSHAEHEAQSYDENGEPARDENGNVKYKVGKPRVYRGPNPAKPGSVGDIVETHIDLSKLFNPPGNPGGAKFESLDGPGFTPSRKNTLKMKTVKELREFAEEEELDLGDLTLKADIIQAILDVIGDD